MKRWIALVLWLCCLVGGCFGVHHKSMVHRDDANGVQVAFDEEKVAKEEVNAVVKALDKVSTSRELMLPTRVEDQHEEMVLEEGMLIRGNLYSYSLVRRIEQYAVWDYVQDRAKDFMEASNAPIPDASSHVLQLPSSSRKDLAPVVLQDMCPPLSELTRSLKKTGFDEYMLKRKFGAGGQGEIWQAIRADGAADHVFVLKRVFVERGEEYLRSGMREQVFGQRLKKHDEIVRFVEAFNHTNIHTGGVDMWLVFRHEGQSLDALLYSRVESGESMLIKPSSLWQTTRKDANGAKLRREVIKQILEGLSVVHEANVVHRDIKPSNILISEVSKRKKAMLKNVRDFQVKISDFGSALDMFDGPLNMYLYGEQGPTENEETKWYRPPEAFLAGVTSTRFPYLGNDQNGVEPISHNLPFHAYDIWSVGVVALEMLLGTSEIFTITPREKAKIDLDVDRISYLYASEEDILRVKELRYKLRAFSSFGIALNEKHGNGNRTMFQESVRKRDPFKNGFYFQTKSGFENIHDMMLFGDNELDFVWSLLAWNPFDRPTAKQALEHPFFHIDF